MKTYICVIVLPLLTLPFFVLGQGVQSDTIFNEVGEDIFRVLSTADSVEAFLLNGWNTNADIEFRGYEIVDSKELTNSQYRILSQALVDDNSYIISNDVKHCHFVPNIGVRLKANGDTCEVLFSLGCQVMKIISGDDEKTLDIDPIVEPLENFFSMVFVEHDIIAASVNNLPSFEWEEDSTDNGSDEENDEAEEGTEDSEDEDTDNELEEDNEDSELPDETEDEEENNDSERSTPRLVSEITGNFEEVDYTIYKVKEGENLTTVSRKFDVPITDVRDLNQLKNVDHIEKGQVLKIPKRK